jgi:hypothetical protein
MSLFKKLTISEQQEIRVNEVVSLLFKTYDSRFNTLSFTELETVQILNMVRRKLNDEFEKKRIECLERSVNETQKAAEIQEALSYLE